MAGDAELSLIVRLRDEATKGLQNLSGQMNKVGSDFKEVSQSAKNVAIGMAAIGAAALAFGYKAVDAAAASQVEMLKVDTILKTLNTDFETNKQAVLQAAEAANKFGFDNEESALSIARLQQVTGTFTSALEANQVAMDLARMKNLDLETATKLVGQAYQGNGRVLQEFGIQVKEAGTPLEIFGELQDKVRGQSQAFSESYRGHVEQFKNSWGDLMKVIGQALLPLLTKIVDYIIPIIKGLENWVKAHPKLTTAILATTVALGALATAALALGAIFATLAPIVTFLAGPGFAALVSSIGGAIVAFGWIVIPIMAAVAALGIYIYKSGILASLLAGDFSNAWHIYANTVNTVWNGIVSFVEWGVNAIIDALIRLADPLGLITVGLEKLGIDVGVSFESLKSKSTAFYETTTHNFSELGAATGAASEDFVAKMGEMEKGMTGTQYGAQKLKEQSSADIQKFVDSASEDIDRVNEKLTGLQRSLAELVGQYAQQEATDREALAEAIVASEQKVTDMKKEQLAKRSEMVKTDDIDRKVALNQEILDLDTKIATEVAAQTKHANVIKQLDNEVKEVKRKNKLTDLELAIENFNKERAEARQVFEEKVLLMQEEIAELEKQKATILKDLEKHNADIMRLQKTATGAYKVELDQQLTDTKNAVNEMLTMFNALAAARASALGKAASSSTFGGFKAAGGSVQSGKSYVVGENGPELFSPGQSGFITPNHQMAGGVTVINNIYGDISGDDVVDKIEEKLMKRLKYSGAVA